jgi:hypothetical protein
MKSAPVFAIGFACGIAAALIWHAAFTAAKPSPEDPGALSHRPAAGSPAAMPEATRPVRRILPAAGASAGIQDRLRAAVAAPLPPATPAVPGGVASTRVSDWLAANGIDPGGEALAALNGFVEESGGDPLVPGSAYDHWLHERLDPAAREAWVALQQEHVADLVERRSNRLLGEIQAEIPLSPAEKDALFSALSEQLVPGETALLGQGEPPDEEGGQRWIEERQRILVPRVAESRRARLAEWLEDHRPGYWAEEAARH